MEWVLSYNPGAHTEEHWKSDNRYIYCNNRHNTKMFSDITQLPHSEHSAESIS